MPSGTYSRLFKCKNLNLPSVEFLAIQSTSLNMWLLNTSSPQGTLPFSEDSVVKKKKKKPEKSCSYGLYTAIMGRQMKKILLESGRSVNEIKYSGGIVEVAD